jgi:hypothetical protein
MLRPVLATGFLILLLACSEVTGVALSLVGELPRDFGDTLQVAAANAGFVDARVAYPVASREPDAYFFERPSENGASRILIEAGHAKDGYKLSIGRPIYGGYTTAENAAVVSFVEALRARNVKLRLEWVRDIELPRDLHRWLEANHMRPNTSLERTRER